MSVAPTTETTETKPGSDAATPPPGAPPPGTSPGSSPGSSPDALEAERAFCIRLLPEVSRTFALSIEALPTSLREAVRVAYLLCRIVDTIEDEADLPPEVRHDLFDRFDATMASDDVDPAPLERAAAEAELAEGSPDGELVRGSAAVFAVYRDLPGAQRKAIRPHVLEMSKGMREYDDRAYESGGNLRLTSLADLERYCYFVAGTVGLLLTALFELEVPTLDDAARETVRKRAVSFGLGLQMVNIVKDVATDIERDVCYLPTELADAEGIELTDILEPELRDAALNIVHAVCERARNHLVAAQEYTLAWPEVDGRDVRLFCTVPLVLALATLTEVEQGEDTLRPGFVPKVSRQVVAEVLQRAHTAIDSDEALLKFFEDYGGGLE